MTPRIGGAIRLGRAIALALAGAGMDVAIGYHRSVTAARDTVRASEGQGCRGVAGRANLAEPGDASSNRCLALSMRAPFLCAQAAARIMPDGGHVVNIGDSGAGEAWPGYIPYLASKAGVVALTRGLAAALAPRHIAVNCLAPGAVLRPVGATCAPDITGRVLVVGEKRRGRRAGRGGRLRAGGRGRRPS